MRDINRIDQILAELSEIWHELPDMRLMQLLLNLPISDAFMYYIEDNDLIEQLRKYYE